MESLSVLSTLAAIAAMASADGITAGYRGIYICSEEAFKGKCFWHEVQPEDQTGDCLHIATPDGFKSFGPDRGLSVDVTDVKDCGDLGGSKKPWVSGVMCPGKLGLPVGALGSHAKVVKDIWVRVRVVDRLKLGVLTDLCDFHNSDYGHVSGTFIDPSTPTG